jgi:hypothetical protein
MACAAAKSGSSSDRFAEQGQRFVRILGHRREGIGQGAQIEVIGIEAVGPLAPRAFDLGVTERRLDHPRNADGDVILQFEHIFELTVEAVGPEMRPAQRVDQLRRDAHPVSALSHRAFEHVADAELAADLLHIDGLALVRKARIAGDHEEPADAGERSDDLFHHAIGEIFLLRIAAHIGEGQHRNRRLVRQWERSPCGSFLGDRNAVDPHRPGDILDLLLAPVLERKIELVAHLVAHDPADGDPAGLGQRFEASRNIDAVAVDIASVLYDVAEIDPHPKFDAAIGRHIDVSLGHLALHFNRTTHRVDHAAKLDQQAVPGGFYDAAVMLLDLGIGELAPPVL